MSEQSDAQRKFNDRIAAVAIVNNAIIRCQLLGMEVTADNIILCVGDYFDPMDLEYSGVIVEIERAIDSTLGTISYQSALN